MKKSKNSVLISAYACEPGKGSEPEVGWQWVNHLKKHCKVHVLTRANNRENIENFCEDTTSNVVYHYYDLPKFFMILKKYFLKGNLGVSIYALLWHKFAARTCNALIKDNDIDIFHHLTIASYRIPFIKINKKADIPIVVGPVGGCEDFPKRFLPKSGFKTRFKESLRNSVITITTKNRFFFRRYKRATLILASTQEMLNCFRNKGFLNSELLPTIGVNPLRKVKKYDESKDLKLLYVGNLLYWKGLELAIESLQRLPDNITLTCFGGGPDLAELQKRCHDLGVGKKVFFEGKIPRAQLLQKYRDFDVFLYPSLHDSGSFTVLEAMASGLPVICLDRGGPGYSVGENCGFSIDSSGSRKEVVSLLEEAVLNYFNNRSLIQHHGEEALKRIRENFVWHKKSESMVDFYSHVLTLHGSSSV